MYLELQPAHREFQHSILVLTSYVMVFVQPQIIIHCAAERRPDVVEKDQVRAKLLNETSVSTIAREAGKLSSNLISSHFSFFQNCSVYSYICSTFPALSFVVTLCVMKLERIRKGVGAKFLKIKVVYLKSARKEN